MNRIMKKLCSRAGASITFALLLFLVCAVLCSVILAAATASAGRMSGIAATDQRYYAVTSASELLNDLIGDKKVSIVKVTTSQSTVTYNDGVPGERIDTDPVEKKYLVVGQTAADILAAVGKANDYLNANSQISGEGALGTELPKKSIVNDAAYNYYNGRTTIPAATGGSPRLLSLSSSMASAGVDPLAITIEETLDNTGRITLTVYNANGTDRFKQQLDFSANVVSSDTTKSVIGPIEDFDSWETDTITHTTYTKTTTTTKTEITTLTWTLDNIKTLSGIVSEG